MEGKSLPAGVLCGVGEGGSVPQNVGRDKRKRNGKRDCATAFAQGVPRARISPRVDGHAEHEVDRGVFGEQTKADTCADQRREAHIVAVDKSDPSIEGDGPEQEKRNVGRDQQRGERRPRQSG